MKLIEEINYIKHIIRKKAYSVTNITAIFDAVITPSTSNLETTVQDFQFFVNGVKINHNIIESFEQSGNDAILTINHTQSGWLFNSDDDVIAIGKFN